MRAQEIIRAVLNMLDQSDQPDSRPGEMSPLANGDDTNRFKQIMDLIAQERRGELQNTPQEEYADIDSVTIHAGGGVNGPKHPHDLRVKDPSQHPDQQEY